MEVNMMKQNWLFAGGLGLVLAAVIGAGPALQQMNELDAACLKPQEFVASLATGEDAVITVDGKYITMSPEIGKRFLEITEFPFLLDGTQVIVYYPPENSMVIVMPFNADGCMIAKETGVSTRDEEADTVPLAMVVNAMLFQRLLDQATKELAPAEPAEPTDQEDI